MASGSSSIFDGVSEQGLKSYLANRATRAILASRRANRMPIQFLGPWPNPRKAYLEI